MDILIIVLAPALVGAGGVVSFFVGLYRHSLWFIGGGLIAAILGIVGFVAMGELSQLRHLKPRARRLWERTLTSGHCL